MGRKIVIIGGVAGGATAATRLRRLNEDDHIILLEKGEYISFANCGLPYHIGDVIKDRDALLLQTVQGISSQYGLDVRNLSEVTQIDPEAKTVTIHNSFTDETYTENYDELIISTGARPIVPPIPGLKLDDGELRPNIFTLRDIPDMDAIKAYINTHNIKKAAVIGGGFIGVELMENLTDLGIEVTVIEAEPQLMNLLDFEMAQILHAQINLHNVELVLGDRLAEVQDEGHKVVLSSGREIDTDLILLGIGVAPENELAKAAGVEIGTTGGIVVDEQLRTSVPNIYAIGDVIEVKDRVTGLPARVPLAWPANRQGRLVADVINGVPAAYPGTWGTSVAKIFELTAASTGANQARLDKAGIPYQQIHIHPNSHAGYYPGASPIALKLLFSPDDGRILGAQGVGTEGVDKRIDVIATAMQLGASAPDLASLELAYAPPYSSAKDPVNMLGYIAQNLMGGLVKTFEWSDVERLRAEGAYFLDVREDFELATGVIEGAHQIPLNQLRARIDEVPTDQPIYVFCQVGLRGYNAARVLAQHGRDPVNLDGGFKTLKQAEFQPKAITHVSTTGAVAGATATSGPVASIIQPAESEGTPVTAPLTDPNFTPAPSTLPVHYEVNPADIIQVDACGLQCPGPILKVKSHIDQMNDGQVMEIQASDFGFSADIDAWCANTGNTLLDNRIEGNKVIAKIAKGAGAVAESGVIGGAGGGGAASVENGALLPAGSTALGGSQAQLPDGATIVLFSGDLDKALAAMIIASGAAAYGKKVTIFCTFWGLNVLKDKHRSVEKKGIAKMFDVMMPSDANRLPLSQMNMGGMGAAMIKQVMKNKNVDSLPTMIENAHELGVKFIACTMSMDLMGVSKDELFDFVEFGGVGAYIGDSEKANIQLFI